MVKRRMIWAIYQDFRRDDPDDVELGAQYAAKRLLYLPIFLYGSAKRSFFVFYSIPPKRRAFILSLSNSGR